MAKPNFYETLYLTRPDLKEDELGKVQQKLADTISSHEGEIFKSQKWAERDLAYRIGNYTKGVYYIMVYKALPEVVADMEKNLRFYSTDVLRFITLRIKEATALREKASSEKQIAGGGM